MIKGGSGAPAAALDFAASKCCDTAFGRAEAWVERAQRATLAAVAREAGVSVPTVSKVVNGRTDVAPETRARIESLLVRHGYVARGAGGAQPVARTVDLVFDAMQTPNNLDIMHGALEAAAAEDVDIVVGTVPPDPLGAAWARRMAAA